MMRLLPLLILLAGCQQAAPQGNATGQTGATAPAPSGGSIDQLTGLYEGGQGQRRNQLCMVVNSPTDTRFGLVVWGRGQNSCSGSGSAERSGDRLQLKMTGDETCALEARIESGNVILPDTIPDGCAYYCGAGASMTGARFAQAGTGRDEAIKAKDLVGDPLC